ncbi:MAG: HD domain-containing protein [Patescibacteria group bacterium]|mgnify:CR=1 FL=1
MTAETGNPAGVNLQPLHIDILNLKQDGVVRAVFETPGFKRVVEPFLLDLLEVDRRGAQHSVRTAELTVDLATQMGLSEARIAQLIQGALLHDVGKIEVGKAILDSPKELTAEERARIRRHVQYGRDMLLQVGRPREAMIAYGHHKKGRDPYPGDDEFDPKSLSDKELREDIDFINLVDIIDAARYPRVYRADPVSRAQLHAEIDSLFGHERVAQALDAHHRMYAGAYDDK